MNFTKMNLQFKIRNLPVSTINKDDGNRTVYKYHRSTLANIDLFATGNGHHRLLKIHMNSSSVFFSNGIFVFGGKHIATIVCCGIKHITLIYASYQFKDDYHFQ